MSEGWHRTAGQYHDFIRRHENLRVLYLGPGMGANTPAIIKYPFWQMTYRNPRATYACINCGQADAPREIEKRSICISADIDTVLGARLSHENATCSLSNLIKSNTTA